MSVYTVIEAESKGQRPDKGYGPMQVIALSLKGESGTPIVAEWYTKATTPVPTPGSSVDGDVTQGKFGMQFKKAKPEGGGGGTWKPRDPKDTAAIQRQASQRTATMFLQAKVAAGAVETFPTWQQFTSLVDMFERDIQNTATPYGEPLARVDSELTGESDVPSNGAPVHPPTPLEGTPWAT